MKTIISLFSALLMLLMCACSGSNLDSHKVKIKNVANGMSMEYTIVADSEANLKEKKIASSTPIAQGLLGHKRGDIVEIRVPSGLMKFEIVEISF